jgi:type III secretory pathway component EscS
MDNEEVASLLREIRDLQKVQIANNLEAVKNQTLRAKKSIKVLMVFLVIFLAVNWGLAYLPSFFNR